MPPDRRPDTALTRDRFTGIGKAARDLGLAPRTVRSAVAAGQIDAFVFGQRARIRVADVRAWIERCRRAPGR
jgi:excisionase family DNA binding protein